MKQNRKCNRRCKQYTFLEFENWAFFICKNISKFLEAPHSFCATAVLLIATVTILHYSDSVFGCLKLSTKLLGYYALIVCHVEFNA